MANENRLAVAGSQPVERDDQGTEIDLVELLYRLLEKARYLVLGALIGALIAGVYTLQFVKPTYQATSKLYIVNNKDSVINLQDLQMSTNLAQDYIEVFDTFTVKENATNKLLQLCEANGVECPDKDVKVKVNVTNQNGTRILTVAATSTNPQIAMWKADAYAEAAQQFIAEVMRTDEPSTFERAEQVGIPENPVSPNKTRNIILGFIIGMVIAAAVVIVQFIVDDRVRNAEVLEKKLGLPVLGMMPATGQEEAPKNKKHKHSKQSARSSGRKGGAR